MGDEVVVYIPDSKDVDHRYHERTGTITDVLEDDLSGLTGDPCHDYLYTVDFDDDELGAMDFRYNDLNPV